MIEKRQKFLNTATNYTNNIEKESLKKFIISYIFFLENDSSLNKLDLFIILYNSETLKEILDKIKELISKKKVNNYFLEYISKLESKQEILLNQKLLYEKSNKKIRTKKRKT